MKLALLVLFLVTTIACADEPAKKKPSVSDQASGLTVSVQNDDRTLVAADTRSGKIVWKADVIQAAGKPNVGEPVVRDLTVKDGVLTAIYGKHSFAKLELKTGKLLEKGSD